jgi:hypothetical protein
MEGLNSIMEGKDFWIWFASNFARAEFNYLHIQQSNGEMPPEIGDLTAGTGNQKYSNPSTRSKLFLFEFKKTPFRA